MKSLLFAAGAAVVLASSGTTSNTCSSGSGYCRSYGSDGGCVFYLPVCCDGSAPKCGEGQTLVQDKTEGCQEAGVPNGVGCA